MGKTGDVESGSPVVSQVVVFNADCAGPSANKALFLKECSTSLAPVQCMEMKCGSVEVTLRGRKIYVSQRLEKLKKDGLKLPSFKQMDFKQAGAQTSTGTTKPSGSAKTTASPETTQGKTTKKPVTTKKSVTTKKPVTTKKKTTKPVKTTEPVKGKKPATPPKTTTKPKSKGRK